MLHIVIPKTELWDDKHQVFIYIEEQKIQLEHSLISLSKWESKWKKPFLDKKEKPTDEALDYIRCMTITKNVRPEAYLGLCSSDIKTINDYIENTMTATQFTDHSLGKKSHEIVTAEIIYYWMIALNVPMECQKWHLNRLLTLIKVLSIKNQPQKKQSTRSIMRQNSAINAARRKHLHTKG